jgi:hypothetical protein
MEKSSVSDEPTEHTHAVNHLFDRMCTMKQGGIQAVAKPERVRTTDSNHDLPVAENVLDRDFTPTESHVAWVGDITSVRTLDGWLFLLSWWICFRVGLWGGRWIRR